MLFFWTFQQRILKKQFAQKYYLAQLFSTLLKIWNVSLAANQHISMSSEGSCDTEDWSNDGNDEIQLCITGINYILKCIIIENR